MPVCCVCGSADDARWCELCGHYFCRGHRRYWQIIGVWQRGVAALKEWRGQKGTPYCDTDPTPPTPSPPDFSAEATDLLGDKAKLADKLKRDLMEHYLIEAEFGKRKDVNPQHSRASRKQGKELAELIWRLNAEANK